MPRRPIGRGWSLDLPPEFTQSQQDGQHLFHAPGGRTLYAVVYPTTNTDAQAALAQMTRDRGIRPAQTFTRSQGPLTAEAWLLPEQDAAGNPYWSLNTWTSAPHTLACVTIYFPDPQSLDWAKSIWDTVLPGPIAEGAT